MNSSSSSRPAKGGRGSIPVRFPQIVIGFTSINGYDTAECQGTQCIIFEQSLHRSCGGNLSVPKGTGKSVRDKGKKEKGKKGPK
jgi:hypothetical protein